MDLNASFEDEVLAMNPEYDLIFSKYDEARLNMSPQFFEPQRKCSPRQMKVISEMNQMLGIKPLGELATHKDWENTDSTEKETIALMRKLGLEPSIDQAPDERRTISTVPINDDIIVNRNGRKKMQVFMGNSYFALKPRSGSSYFTEEDEDSKQISSNETSASELTDSSYMYEPIQLDVTNETELFDRTEECFEKDKVNLNKRLSNSEINWRNNSPGSSRGSRSGRQTYSNDASSSFSRRSTDSDVASSTSKNWWRSSDSIGERRDENNWRISASKPVEEIEQKLANVVVKESTATRSKPMKENKLKQPTVAVKESMNIRNFSSVSKPVEEIKQKQPPVAVQESMKIRNCSSVSKPVEEIKQKQPTVTETSNCGSPLYKPKELFLRRRAQLIQQ